MQMRLNRVRLGWIKLLLLTSLALLAATTIVEGKSNSNSIERWGIFELALKGPEGDNPFIDVKLSAEFKLNGRVFEPEGF
ncbi:MAG: DUF5060 domain-containing protein, partial [Phycisphaerae bacterium]